MKTLIRVFLVVGFLVVLSGCSSKTTRQNEVVSPGDGNLDNVVVNKGEMGTPSSTLPENVESIDKKVYFGGGIDGEYSFLNIENEEVKAIIPSGYKIVSQHNYDVFPDYFILQRDGDLFSFKLEGRVINSIPNLKLGQDERASIEPSITEKDKFHILINEYDPNEESDFGFYSPVSTRSYFFDASLNNLDQAKTIDLYDCYKYDSKNKRIFTWYCGEGAGYTIPLFVSDLDGGNLREIVSTEDYGLQKDDLGPVYANYNNGAFIVLEKAKPTKITVVNPTGKELVKEVYSIDDDVRSQLKDSLPYSVAIDRDNRTIVIGGGNFILLLKYNDNNKIIESKYFEDSEIYANFIFPYNGKIIYQSKNVLKVINTSSWQIEKTMPIQIQRREEITLIN